MPYFPIQRKERNMINMVSNGVRQMFSSSNKLNAMLMVEVISIIAVRVMMALISVNLQVEQGASLHSLKTCLERLQDAVRALAPMLRPSSLMLMPRYL